MLRASGEWGQECNPIRSALERMLSRSIGFGYGPQATERDCFWMLQPGRLGMWTHGSDTCDGTCSSRQAGGFRLPRGSQ